MKDTTSLSLGRETLLSFASKLVMAAVGFGGTVVFARLLGPDGLGVYKTAIAAAFVATQVSAGTGSAIRKRVSEVDIDPPEFYGAGLVVHGVFSGLVVLGYLAARPVVDDFFSSGKIAAAVVAVVFSLGLFTLVNRAYSGLGYPSRSTWIDTLRSVLTLAFQLWFVLNGWGPLGLVVGFVVGTLLSAGVSMLAAGVVPAVPGRRALERVYEFARWSVSNALLNRAYGRADVLLINALVGSGPVGFYTTAAQLTMPGAMFSGSIRDSLSVKSSGLSSVGADLRADLENAVSYAGLISWPILFGALAIPTPIMVTVFGAAFGPAGAALVGMTVFKLLHVYRLPFEAVAEGADQPSLIARTNVLVMTIYLPAALGLGLAYGLLGVIAGSIVGELGRLATYQVVARRHFGGIVLPRPVLEQFASGALMALAVEAAVPTVIAVRSWLHLGAVVVGAAGLYFGALFVLSWHFRHTVASAVADATGVALPFGETGPGDEDE